MIGMSSPSVPASSQTNASPKLVLKADFTKLETESRLPSEYDELLVNRLNVLMGCGAPTLISQLYTLLSFAIGNSAQFLHHHNALPPRFSRVDCILKMRFCQVIESTRHPD